MRTAAWDLVPLPEQPTQPVVVIPFAAASNDAPAPLTPLEQIAQAHPAVQNQREMYTKEHIRQMRAQTRDL